MALSALRLYSVKMSRVGTKLEWILSKQPERAGNWASAMCD